MGYDYTLEFLYRNKADVEMLDDALRSRQVYKREFDRPRDVQTEQKRINNVMRSLAVNYPDQYTDLRETIRTWTVPPTKTNPKWILCVGPAWDKMPGRRPGATLTSQYSKAGIPDIAIGEEYQFQQVISEEQHMIAFMGKVLELPPSTKKVTAEFVHEIDLDYFKEVFDGWRPSANGPTTLVLERD